MLLYLPVHCRSLAAGGGDLLQRHRAGAGAYAARKAGGAAARQPGADGAGGGEWRDKVKQRFSKMSDRRRFWERAFNGLFASQMAAGNVQGAADAGRAVNGCAAAAGRNYFSRRRSGRRGLLTLRALQVMQQADVVLYDHLVSDEILDLVRRDADRLCVGKRAGAHSVAQEETNRLLVQLASKGNA